MKRQQIKILHDTGTSREFVTELLQEIFGQDTHSAKQLLEEVGKQGSAICGQYPEKEATKRVRAARNKVRKSGYPLKFRLENVTNKPAPQTADGKRDGGTKSACSFCGMANDEVDRLIAGETGNICNECVIRCGEVLVEAANDRHSSIPMNCWRGISIHSPPNK